MSEQILADHARAEGEFDGLWPYHFHADARPENQMPVLCAKNDLSTRAVFFDRLIQDWIAIGKQVSPVTRQEGRYRAPQGRRSQPQWPDQNIPDHHEARDALRGVVEKSFEQQFKDTGRFESAEIQFAERDHEGILMMGFTGIQMPLQERILRNGFKLDHRLCDVRFGNIAARPMPGAPETPQYPHAAAEGVADLPVDRPCRRIQGKRCSRNHLLQKTPRMNQLRDVVRQNLCERRNIRRIGFDPCLEIIRQVPAQLVCVG